MRTAYDDELNIGYVNIKSDFFLTNHTHHL